VRHIFLLVFTKLRPKECSLTTVCFITRNFDIREESSNDDEELHNLYSSSDIIRQVKSRRMRWAGHVARMGEERKVYKVLVGNPEGKRPLGRPRRRWEDGVRMDLKEIGLGGVWIGFDWLRTGTGGGLL
jgi:hypothetical protein